MKFKISESKTFNNLIVYDFDDTIVTTNAKIKIIKENGEEIELSTAEYAEYIDQPGDKVDYSDFRQPNLIDPKVTELFDKNFINDMLDDTSDVAILTARPNNNQLIEFFYTILPNLGYNFTRDELRKINFVPIGRPEYTLEEAANAKKEWINQQIYNYGYDSVVFYDDGDKNIDAIDKLKIDWPNIDIKTVKIDV